MIRLYSIFAVCLALLASCTAHSIKPVTQERLTDFVDPFIGTAAHGHTFPGPAWPFGQVQLSPDNGTQGWDWCSGYNYSDSTIAGFSHLHLSGTGMGDLNDISFLPVTGKVVLDKAEKNETFITRYAAKFSHSQESARAGYYSVILKNSGIKAEFTVTERAGLHRYTFPENGERNLIVNLGFAINMDKPCKSSMHLVNDTLLTGTRLSTGWAEDQHVYFAARFSEPVTKSEISSVGGDEKAVGWFNFKGKDLLVKVGISSVSIENAIQNLDASLPGWNFEAVKQAASDAWEKELTRIRIKSDDKATKTVFYTSLYHTMIAPALFSDQNGQFKGLNGKAQEADGYNRYTVFSLWDTYRALHPLYTIFQQDRVNDMVKTMLDQYNQIGILPVWELEGNETYCMVGNHSISVVAEAILKGIGDFNKEAAYEAMKATSMHDRDGMGYWDKLGYMPADKVDHSVAKAMEVAIDDWAVAAVAQKLGKQSDAKYFFNRAGHYRNFFDKETGFMRGKLSDGKMDNSF